MGYRTTRRQMTLRAEKQHSEPEAAAEIERLQSELVAANVRAGKYSAGCEQCEPLRAEIERLRAALEPFADYADPSNRFPATAEITHGSKLARRQLTMGDCYAAHAALA